MSKVKKYPDSAISSWSGFVYQGKVALYHCLKLINEGDEDFELQLDSTDDFAIYKGNTLSSAHQVKAKVGKYRSDYRVALEKSALIELDRIQGITRFFHVSIPISDTSDYKAGNGEVVEFYAYNGDKYCSLGDIETLTKSIISDIFKNKSLTLSDNFIDLNYYVASEYISSQAIEIHRQIQEEGNTERQAAYTNRISARQILDKIIDNTPYDDAEYYAAELKSRLHTYLEDKLERSLPGLTDEAYERARRLYFHIRDADISELKTLCQLMKPSERFSRIQKADIRRYSGLIQELRAEPIFTKVPHYRDEQKEFYMPTALDLPEAEENSECASDIISEMKNNDDLIQLLYEYNNLIASRATESFLFDTKYTACAGLNEQEMKSSIDSHITKKLCISVITKEDAEARLT